MTIDLVYDNLDATGGEALVVEATISLLSTEDGGKPQPITARYRPNHNFGSPENRSMFVGQVELHENEFLHPGESRDLLVRFLNVRGLAEKLFVGSQWRLQEGLRLVGTGRVKRIVSI